MLAFKNIPHPALKSYLFWTHSDMVGELDNLVLSEHTIFSHHTTFLHTLSLPLGMLSAVSWGPPIVQGTPLKYASIINPVFNSEFPSAFHVIFKKQIPSYVGHMQSEITPDDITRPWSPEAQNTHLCTPIAIKMGPRTHF